MAKKDLKAKIAAAFSRKAWTTLDDIIRPIKMIIENYPLNRKMRVDKVNEHIKNVVDSKDSYPKPITDDMINQALIVARQLLGEDPNSSSSDVIDPRRAP